MKRIIKGKVYDTKTAKRLGEYAPTPYRSDFHWYREELYLKKTGEFFLHGEGNAASKYARSVAMHETAPGEAIRPLTHQEAQDWVEKYLEEDEYVAIFGEPEEDEEKTHLHVYIRSDLVAKLKQVASVKGLSLSKLIEDLLSEQI